MRVSTVNWPVRSKEDPVAGLVDHLEEDLAVDHELVITVVGRTELDRDSQELVLVLLVDGFDFKVSEVDKRFSKFAVVLADSSVKHVDLDEVIIMEGVKLDVIWYLCVDQLFSDFILD
jgi:hypothetical protein